MNVMAARKKAGYLTDIADVSLIGLPFLPASSEPITLCLYIFLCRSVLSIFSNLLDTEVQGTTILRNVGKRLDARTT